MNEIRPLLHEILNALSIARGLAEGVESSLNGELELTKEQCLDKLKRSFKAMDRIETAAQEIRTQIQNQSEKP